MPSAPFPLDIDADITRAHTLPARFYRDPAMHAWLAEHVFARSWQLIGDTDLARTPQSVVPFDFLEGAVEEPLLLTRDAADALHVLSNVCTHRGNLVAAAPARCAHLRCPYHGRRFALDGTFEHMPEFDAAVGFPCADDSLPQLPRETWGGFHFTAIDPAWSFNAWIAPVRDRIPWFPFDDLVFDASRSRDYLVRANWALYCDNYLEGFHIPFVHAGLNAVLDYGAYRTELFDWGSLQLGIASGGEDLFKLPAGAIDAGVDVAAYYFWLFPNLMINVYPWGISINVVKPLAPDRTKIAFLTWVADPSRVETGAGAGLDRVEREDEAVVESVQRGISGRLYRRGRYSPDREQGVHHFHRLLAALAD